MRFFAHVIMRGTVSAFLLAALACMLEITFLLGTAATALVTLRKGVNYGLIVALGALLGGFAWYSLSGSITTLLVIGSTLLAAIGLRETNQWQLALIIVLAGCIISCQFLLQFSATYLDTLTEFYNSMRTRMQTQLAEEQLVVSSLTQADAAGLVALLTGYASVISLALGRWWQSELFNPGGFAKEFQALRLHPGLALALVTGSLLCLFYKQAIWSSIFALPLVIAGIALVHAYATQQRLGKHWLILFYMLLILGGMNLFLVLLAVADSQLNFRQRWR